jgi:VWFA-related protein
VRAKWVWLSLWLAGVLCAQSSQPPLVLRSETRAVQINVVVKNKSGEPVRDLRREDFTIFDDGKPRAVQFFTAEMAPTAGTPSHAAARYTAIVIDALNTEFSDQSYMQYEAIKAVKRMPLDESIAVLHLAPDLALLDFTHNRSALLAAINRFQPIMPPYAMKKRVQITIGALKTLADRMNRAGGRKSIVWITGGFPTVRVYQDAIEEMLHRIEQSDVAIYPVDPRGLMLGAGNGANFETMDQFAVSTGGRAYYNNNDVSGGIEEAIADSRSAYTIGFYLADNERDRRFHTLKVDVNRPGATVRYRRGYAPSAAR